MVRGGLHLVGELAGAREDGLDVGGGGLLAPHLGHVRAEVQRQHRLVVGPEGTQVEARPALVVAVGLALPHTAHKQRSQHELSRCGSGWEWLEAREQPPA